MLQNNKLIYLASVLCGLSAGFWSCEKTSVAVDNFYPEIEGPITYLVTEVQYSALEAPKTKTYFLIEELGETIDAKNNIRKLIRKKSNELNLEFKTDSIWLIQRLPNKIIRTENGKAITKMVFPTYLNATWLPYPQSTDNYTITKIMDLDKSYEPTLGLELTLVNDSSLIAARQHQEIYQQNVGLIYKIEKNVQYCQDSPECIGKGQISYGTIRETRLYQVDF